VILALLFKPSTTPQGAFAVAPRNSFDGDNAAAAIVDPTHGVQEEDEKPS
jgi:hypothetical protein